MSYVPDSTTSIRFKAQSENQPEQDKIEESFGYTQKSEYPKSFLSKDMFGNYINSNHQLSNVSDEQQKFLEIAKKENITEAHARIKTYAEKWKDVPEYKWTIGDIVKWKTTGGDDYIHKEKIGFIKNYKDVILDAAEKYNIPPVLLAGVAYVEYGGDPMWIDDIAYAVRSFDWSGPKWVDENLTITKNPDFTSFGNTSIQVRRALEMLGYDASSASRKAVIDSLKDPIQNIYLTACHLNILQNVDYKGKKPADLTDDEIKVIASRYNLGPDIPLNDVETGYGERIYNNKDDILKALS